MLEAVYVCHLSSCILYKHYRIQINEANIYKLKVYRAKLIYFISFQLFHPFYHLNNNVCNPATIVPVLRQDLDFHGICGSGERYICLCFVDIGGICDDQFTITQKKMEMNSIQHWLSHGIVYLRNNSWGLEYILILPQVGPLCQIFYPER
jgi:hypothetical protein